MSDDTVSFFAQLKQRHVFRVAAMYCVIAWLLMQLGSVTFEPLGFPAWSQKALIILVAVGFPIALVLAWIFDATPHGVVVTDSGSAPRMSRGRKLDIVIIVGLVAALALTFLWRREPASTPRPVVDASVAVLAFVPIGTDPALKPLGEALAEQITNELAGRAELRVASCTSAFEVQSGKDAVAIARALGVSYVLEGSVRPADQRTRVTAQLVRGSDGEHLWSETYDIAADQNAELDRTATTVSFMVTSYIALEQVLQLARTQTQSQAAYEHFAVAQRLRWVLNTGGATAPKPGEQILGETDRALSLDPDFVPALLLRANIYLNKFGNRACGARCPAEARKSIEHALALQPDDPSALDQLSVLQLEFDLDPSAAEATLDRVRQVDPGYRYLNLGYAQLAMFRGNTRDARDYLARQIEMTPYDAYVSFAFGVLLRSLGDITGAERAFDTSMRVAPRGLSPVAPAVQRISLLIERGDDEKAKAAFEPLWAEYRYSAPEVFAPVLGRLGHQQEAKELAAQLARDATANPADVFLTYYGPGEYNDALIWMRRAIDDRGIIVIFLRVPNLLPGLQEQPGYAEALKYLDSLQKSR